jgi:UDP-GlcNAc:undecaprenyl-phosphate/decaprenyl-phosphate GlcNAc-1-phosphate transferase
MLFSLLAALVLSGCLAYGLQPLVRAIGLVDTPDGLLKDHRVPTPITGGLAILGSFAAVSTLVGVFDPVAIAVAVGVLVLGTYDDFRPLAPPFRLCVVLALGALLTLSPEVPDEAGPTLLAAALLTLAVNSVNLLDGADGVAASAGVGTATGLSVLSWVRGVDPRPGLIVLGAIAGFLFVNWPPAKVFLGDGGTYVVGALLSVTALAAQQEAAPLSEVWLPQLMVSVAMFGVFLVDLVQTMYRRLSTRSGLMAGDRLHVYDRLRDRGWPPSTVALAVGASQAAIVSLVLLLDSILEPWPAGIVATLTVFGVAIAVQSGDSR